jgi:hypothetical protein
MVNFLINIVLMLHGLVHVWYIVLAQGWVEFQTEMGWTGSSWLLSSRVTENTLSWIVTLGYGIAAAGFVIGGVGNLTQQVWSQSVLIFSAVFSSLLLVIFWDGNFSLLVEKGLLGLIINLALIVFVMTR